MASGGAVRAAGAAPGGYVGGGVLDEGTEGLVTADRVEVGGQPGADARQRGPDLHTVGEETHRFGGVPTQGVQRRDVVLRVRVIGAARLAGPVRLHHLGERLVGRLAITLTPVRRALFLEDLDLHAPL